jgi:hypothetical protein
MALAGMPGTEQGPALSSMLAELISAGAFVAIVGEDRS